jgi:ABC-type sugar transport system ATPase subunit
MYLRLENVVKVFPPRGGSGEVTAVDGVSLDIQKGSLVTLLGPSGCGKTTTLRLIGGFEFPTAGRIWLDGEEITALAPHLRGMAMVFQSYAIFPHLNVFENVAYGLHVQRRTREEIGERVDRVLELVELTGLAQRAPNQLSGGQQQRVALARALVMEPKVLLLDEPLSNLDAKLREQMRTEIRRIQQKLEITSVYVTHDQIEAMAMGDRIVVMSAAVVQQVGTPIEVYNNPANLFVARFIGSPGMNLVKCSRTEAGVRMGDCDPYPLPPGWAAPIGRALANRDELVVGFRPEAARVSPTGRLAGEVYATDMHGGYTVLHAKICEGEIVHIRSDRQANFPMGATVRFDLEPDMVRFFDPASELALQREPVR